METVTLIVTNVTGELDSLLAPLGVAVHVQPGNAPALANPSKCPRSTTQGRFPVQVSQPQGPFIVPIRPI